MNEDNRKLNSMSTVEVTGTQQITIEIEKQKGICN